MPRVRRELRLTTLARNSSALPARASRFTAVCTSSLDPPWRFTAGRSAAAARRAWTPSNRVVRRAPCSMSSASPPSRPMAIVVFARCSRRTRTSWPFESRNRATTRIGTPCTAYRNPRSPNCNRPPIAIPAAAPPTRAAPPAAVAPTASMRYLRRRRMNWSPYRHAASSGRWGAPTRTKSVPSATRARPM